MLRSVSSILLVGFLLLLFSESRTSFSPPLPFTFSFAVADVLLVSAVCPVLAINF